MINHKDDHGRQCVLRGVSRVCRACTQPYRKPAKPAPCAAGGTPFRWDKEALQQPEAALIVEGTPILDPKYNAITVFAQNATTKLL